MKKKLTYLSDDGTCYVCYDFYRFHSFVWISFSLGYIHNNMRTSTNAMKRVYVNAFILPQRGSVSLPP